jgi:hypothetical protein
MSIAISYSTIKPFIRKTRDREEVFCKIRKRWLLLTPEEWVRQNFLIYLTEVLNYPSSLIAVEKQLIVNQQKRRFDIVVYKNTMEAFMIVECKEMEVSITEKVIQQVLEYYSVVQSDLMLVTNGNFTFGFRRVGDELLSIDGIPGFEKNQPTI